MLEKSKPRRLKIFIRRIYRIESSIIESSLVIDLEKKQLIGDINNELNKIDFNKYLYGKQITAEQLLEIDTHIETCEDLTNQEIFDLAMHKEVEEENVILEKEEDIISNKDAFLSIEKLFKYFEQQDDFNDEDFNDLNKIKRKIEKNIENNLSQKKITEVFSKVKI